MTDDINAIDLLKEEMQTEDIHLKVNAVHRLKTVVLSIGQSDTVNQLLPYLESKQALQTYNYSLNKPGRRRGSFRNCRRAWQNLGAPLRQDFIHSTFGETCKE